MKDAYDTNKIFFINNTDTTLIATTTGSSFSYTIPYGISSNLCKIKVSNSSISDFDLGDTTFTVLRDTNITITNPTLYQTYSQQDTLDVTFIADFDTAKIYFRLNNASAWEYKGFSTPINRNGILSFILNYGITTEARIMVTNKDSTITKTSDQFYILPSTYLVILSPTTTAQQHYSNGLLVSVMSKGLSDFEFYYDKGNGYNYEANINVNLGDGLAPDTTNFIFDFKKYISSGTLKLMVRKGSQGEIKGSMDTAYFQQSNLVYAGLRSPYQQYQSITKFSKIFQSGDSLYSVCYYAHAYGWYDWNDRIEVYKYNPVTNFFVKIFSKGYPHSAPYPSLDFYRTTTTMVALVKPNAYFQTATFNISNYSLSELSGIFYKSSTNPIPTNIDQNPTNSVTMNFWQYSLINNKIYAYDLINQGNNMLFIDLSQPSSYSTGLKQGSLELFAAAGKLFITNHSYSGSNLPSHTYTLPLFPQNTALSQDEVEITITGTQRNNFRGIYPKAIIKVIPKL